MSLKPFPKLFQPGRIDGLHLLPDKRMKWSALLAFAGTVFAGYLGGVKLFTDTCAFNEPCPYFLGYPACWYGFAMFLILLVVAVLALYGKITETKAWRWLSSVAALGTLFAGRYVVEEILGWFTVGRFQGYGLGLPTCVYGLVFYLLILALAVPRLRDASKS